MDQSIVVLVPWTNLDKDVQKVKEQIRQDGFDFTVEGIGAFPILRIRKEVSSQPARLWTDTKRIVRRHPNVVCVRDVSSLEPNPPRQNTTLAVIYGTETGPALRAKDLASFVYANSHRLGSIWIKAMGRQLRVMLTPNQKLVVLLEQAATDNAIYEVLQNTSHATVFAVVTDAMRARAIRDLDVKGVLVFADLPYGKPLPEGVQSYAKLEFYIWKYFMLTWWQRWLYPLLFFWHRELEMRHLESEV